MILRQDGWIVRLFLGECFPSFGVLSLFGLPGFIFRSISSFFQIPRYSSALGSDCSGGARLCGHGVEPGQVAHALPEELFAGIGFCELQQHPAHADFDPHRHFEQLEPDLAYARFFQLGAFQNTGFEAVHDDVSHHAEPQPQLVARHPVRAGAVGEKIHLLLFDPVFHFAPGAVEVLVKLFGLESFPVFVPFESFAGEVGDDEAQVGFAGEQFELGDDTALPAPAVEGAVAQFGETAERFFDRSIFVAVFFAQFPKRGGNGFGQPGVGAIAKAVEDFPLAFAKRHDVLPGEPAVAAQDDSDFFSEAPTDGGDDFFQGFGGAFGTIDFALPQLGPEGMFPQKA